MKRMLINATQEEELRMAMVDGQRLFDLNIEGPASERKKANIYKGKITRIEPSLEAAFVEYGADRHGFLPLKEISSEYFVKEPSSGGKPNIREVLREGQDIVIQIDKEERGNKGAALTTFVSLAGRFIVLKPNKSRSGGVSRRIVGGDRDLARKSLNDVEIPDGMSVILRTAGIDRSAEELGWDLENLLSVWQAILNVVLERPSPFLIYRESNAVVRALRDYLSNEIGEILIDDDATYNEAREFVEQVMPHNLKKLKHYTDPVPLFTRYQIETQIESAFAHDVSLPSGGSIVIDHTEALVSIDINSARATKGADIETTALNTNLEAAEEIARQLRLRDLGGLIVIDFIDMGPQKNQRAVENKLRESVKQDRARVQIGKISRFGLLEMSRQRLRPSLGESSYHMCPRCSGIGTIRSVESLALGILRIIGEEARKERTAKVIAQLPVEVATYLLNEKRDWVQNLESSNDTQVVLVANSALETPHYDIRRVRDDQADLPENAGASYELVEAEPEAVIPPSIEERKVAEPAAVGKITPSTPAPPRKEKETPKPVEKAKKEPGFIAKILAFFAGDADADDEKPKKKTRKKVSSRSSKEQREGRPQHGQKKPRRKKVQGGDSSQESGEKRTRRKRKRKPRKKAAAQDGSGQEQKQQQSKQAEGQADSQGGTSGPKQAEGQPDPQGEKKKRPSRNRRSRGGRRRRQDAERHGQDEGQEQSSKPADDRAQDPQQKTARTDGPPKARTDEERAADNERAKQADNKPVDKDKELTAARPDAEAKKPSSADAQGKAETSSMKPADSTPQAASAEQPKERPARRPRKPRTADSTKSATEKPEAAAPSDSGEEKTASEKKAKQPKATAPSEGRDDKPPAQQKADKPADGNGQESASGGDTSKGGLLPWAPLPEATAATDKPTAKKPESKPADPPASGE